MREQNGKIDAEMEKAEIEHLRKEMEKKTRTKEPFFQFMPNRNAPVAPIPAPAPVPEKKESTDLFEVPRTSPNN